MPSAYHRFRAACELVHTSTAPRRDPERGRSADADPQYGPSALEGSRRCARSFAFRCRQLVLESDLPEEKRLPDIYAFDGLSDGKVILVPRHQPVARCADRRGQVDRVGPPKAMRAGEPTRVSSNNEVDLDPLDEPVLEEGADLPVNRSLICRGANLAMTADLGVEQCARYHYKALVLAAPQETPGYIETPALPLNQAKIDIGVQVQAFVLRHHEPIAGTRRWTVRLCTKERSRRVRRQTESRVHPVGAPPDRCPREEPGRGGFESPHPMP